MSETGDPGATDRTDRRNPISASGTKLNITPRMWIGVAIAVVAILFIAQNRNSANITLLWIRMSSPLWLTLLIVFLAGLLSGWLIARRRK